MALQNYSLDIQYKKGRLMFIADALSCEYRLTTKDSQQDSSEVRALRKVQHEGGNFYITQMTARFQESKPMTRACTLLCQRKRAR